METICQIELPQKLIDLFDGDARYRVAHGGRGSGKTRGMAKMAAVYGYRFGSEGRQGQILCGREHLNSLDESSFFEIKSAIQGTPWLAEYYDVGDRYIRSKDGNIQFTFAGLRRNIDSIKSKARILLSWIDEAQDVSEEAWRTLLPTVRETDSEVWVSFNPRDPYSATQERWINNPPDDARVVQVNYQDNPFFPEVLERERQNDLQRLTPEVYQHVWNGMCLEIAEGAYYRHEMFAAEEQGRIGNQPYDASWPVVTGWDIGVHDATAIWFAQFVGGEIRLIDYIEDSGHGAEHYVNLLNRRGYNYTEHVLPHDGRNKDWGNGKRRIDVLQNLGLQNVVTVPRLEVREGIDEVRRALGRCWFDGQRCSQGIRALQNYKREWSEKGLVWNDKPLHDWASHGADALRYLVTGHRENVTWGQSISRDAARYMA